VFRSLVVSKMEALSAPRSIGVILSLADPRPAFTFRVNGKLVRFRAPSDTHREDIEFDRRVVSEAVAYLQSRINARGAGVRVDVFPEGGRCTVRSSGLAEAGLAEVEITDCPLRLQDVASNLVLQIALNGRDTPESVADGKVIGGCFTRPDQPVIEVFRLARMSADSLALRIVDVDDRDGMFPHHLVATHLCAAAGRSRDDALRLLLVSIEVWPKEKAASNAQLGDYELNPNNFWAWIDLGTIFSDAERTSDAIAHWKTALSMWPRGGKLYARRMVTRGSPNRATRDFWQSVTTDAIRSWCQELAVELPESALTD
jgi:hypothetical protein